MNTVAMQRLPLAADLFSLDCVLWLGRTMSGIDELGEL